MEKLIPFLFFFLWFLTLFFGILESFTYAGFIRKQIFLGLQFFIFLTITSGLLLRLGLRPQKISRKWFSFYRILTFINYFFFFFIFLGTLVASLVEAVHYPGYVFSQIHLQPKNLFWPTFLALFLIILSPENLKRVFKLTVLNFKKIFVLSLVFWLLIFTLRSATGTIFKNLFFIFRHPSASYDEKMRYHWGDFYDYMIFLKKNTPLGAKIAHPPWEIPPWLSTGSQPLVRYFLYPRQFFQAKDPYSLSSEADYAMLAWGFWPCQDCSYGWPKIKISAEWVIYKKENSSEIKMKLENGVYNPQDEINKSTWGLIKIKKE